MIALETYYIGPSNVMGSRIACRRMDEARKPEGSTGPSKVTVSYPDEYSGERAFFEAVKAFCAKYDWHGKLVCGGTERGYVWVWVPKNTPSTDASDYPQVWEV